MKALVVYDSFFGNTEKIATAIAQSLSTQYGVETIRVSEINMEQLSGVNLLVVGSPTRGFRPSPATTIFLKNIITGSLKGMKVAAFDTRISFKEIDSPILRFFAGIFGCAAQPIAARLVKKGGQAVAEPEGFFVKESEGPLKEGELERAGQWASSFLKA
jgi:flavodoxin